MCTTVFVCIMALPIYLFRRPVCLLALADAAACGVYLAVRVVSLPAAGSFVEATNRNLKDCGFYLLLACACMAVPLLYVGRCVLWERRLAFRLWGVNFEFSWNFGLGLRTFRLRANEAEVHFSQNPVRGAMSVEVHDADVLHARRSRQVHAQDCRRVDVVGCDRVFLDGHPAVRQLDNLRYRSDGFEGLRAQLERLVRELGDERIARQNAETRLLLLQPPALAPAPPRQPATCTICMARPVDCVLLTCRHACACWNCAAILQDRGDPCPMCRGYISHLLRIYIESSE